MSQADTQCARSRSRLGADEEDRLCDAGHARRRQAARAADERLSRARENTIYFLTDARRHKDEEIARDPNINLSFADAGDQKYVSVTGTAVVSNDRAKIKRVVLDPGEGWWDSAEDPNIRVLKITPDDAEFWDSPGTVISYVKMAAAAVTGTPARPRRQPQGRDVDADRAAGNSADNAGSPDRAAAGRSAGQSAARGAAAGARTRRRRRRRRNCRARRPTSCRARTEQPTTPNPATDRCRHARADETAMAT